MKIAEERQLPAGIPGAALMTDENSLATESLKRRIAELEAERDTYLKTLYALMRQEIVFDEEELRHLKQHGIPLEEIIMELERRDAKS